MAPIRRHLVVVSLLGSVPVVMEVPVLYSLKSILPLQAQSVETIAVSALSQRYAVNTKTTSFQLVCVCASVVISILHLPADYRIHVICNITL